MTLTVLVPLDGSPLAARALPFAAHLVAGERGRVVVAHVQVSLHKEAPTGYDPAADVDALRRTGVAATSLVYRAPLDEVADVLGIAIREAGADLVVMSTHGRGGLRRSLFGSVADQLIRRAELPVLLISPQCETSWQARQPTQILVPLDGSPLAEQALGPAATLAGHLDAEILLVRSLSPALHPRYRNDKLTLSCADFVEVEDAWQYLSTIAERVRTDGCRASIRVLVGSPSAAIADAARTERMDVIVMTTHGRGGLTRLVLGSVADGILERTDLPILLVRSGAPQRATAVASTATETAAQADGNGVSAARP